MPDHPDDHLQRSLLLRFLDFGHPEDHPLCKRPFVKERGIIEADGFQYSIITQSTKLSKKSEVYTFIDTHYLPVPKRKQDNKHDQRCSSKNFHLNQHAWMQFLKALRWIIFP